MKKNGQLHIVWIVIVVLVTFFAGYKNAGLFENGMNTKLMNGIVSGLVFCVWSVSIVMAVKNANTPKHICTGITCILVTGYVLGIFPGFVQMIFISPLLAIPALMKSYIDYDILLAGMYLFLISLSWVTFFIRKMKLL